MSEEEKLALLDYYRAKEWFWYRVTCDVPEPTVGEVATDLLRSVYQQWEHYHTKLTELCKEMNLDEA